MWDLTQPAASAEEVRSLGPPLVEAGPWQAPAVLLLDPDGDAKHARLPATWRPLADQLKVVWCRLPALRRLGMNPSQVLLAMAGDDQVHLVASGAAGDPALWLADRHRDVISSVLLVDPSEQDGPVVPHAREVGARGMPVYLIVSRPDGESERPARLPIGHPEVVHAVVRALVEVESMPNGSRAARDGRWPLAGSLLYDAWQAILTGIQRATPGLSDEQAS